MGKIFYLFGKSASGKDSLYKALMADRSLGLKGVVLYTTRPRRSNETEGVEYHFIDRRTLADFREAGRVIEERTYATVAGDWTYATIDDGSFSGDDDRLCVGVLDSYISLRAYFGSGRVIPVYIEVEDGVRLHRALEREESLTKPRYAEMCRRFLADSEDFSEDKLKTAGITRRFRNEDLDKCIGEIREYILSYD